MQQSARPKMMKMLIGILFLMFVTMQFADAQPSVQFTESGLAKAIQQSKAANKPVFYFCYASWCPHCKKMRETLFTDATVAEFCNSHFICVEQDMEKGEGIEQHTRFDITAYPTYIFIDTTGEVMYRLTGEFKPESFIAECKNAFNPKKQLPYLRQQFEKDVSNGGRCLDYLRSLKKGGMAYADVVQRYFATQSEKQLLTSENWIIIANGVTDIHSREFKFVLSHQEDFAEVASPERVKRKIFYMVKDLLSTHIAINDTAAYFADRIPAMTTGLFSVDSLVFTDDLTVYQMNANWAAYRDESLKLTETFAWNNYMQLMDIANVYLNHISDTIALAEAALWARRSLDLHEEFDTGITCAKLYQKLDKTADAIAMAQKAKEIALKNGWDYAAADKLLKELH